MECYTFRNVLERELKNRKSRNAAYSQRAFSRDLGISSGRLSEILSGKEGLSLKSARAIATRLGFSALEIDSFCDLVQAECSRSDQARKLARNRLEHVYPQDAYLDNEKFSLVADWYHFAILELMVTKNASHNQKDIAQRLNIAEKEVEVALERLVRLNLLKKVGEAYKVTQDHTFTGDTVPSRAVRSFHHQILNKAQDALDGQAMDQRDFSSEIIAIDSDKIAEAKRALSEFRKTFCRNMDRVSKQKKKVYALSIQFFSLENA